MNALGRADRPLQWRRLDSRSTFHLIDLGQFSKPAGTWHEACREIPKRRLTDDRVAESPTEQATPPPRERDAFERLGGAAFRVFRAERGTGISSRSREDDQTR